MGFCLLLEGEKKLFTYVKTCLLNVCIFTVFLLQIILSSSV